LLRASFVAAVAGVAAAEVYVALVKGAHVSMSAGFLGGTQAAPITAASFAIGVLVSTFWGTVLSAVLCKLSGHPRRAMLLVSSALAGVSLFVPLDAGATATSTKLALAGAHVIVALIVIPLLARAVPREAQSA
jgi:Family of unknown function (DUF6069)